MSDLIRTSIESFSKDEFREFKYFLASHGDIDGGRHKKLAEIYRKKKSGDEEGMKAENGNAFYLTRKRLKKHLELFMLLENSKNNPDSSINNYIECAKYLFKKNSNKDAWYYLIKAEELAHVQGENELLNTIYYIQIANYRNDCPVDLQFLLEKRNKNLDLARQDGDACCASSLLFHELTSALSRSISVDIDAITQKILSEYSLHEGMDKSVKVFCKITSIVCKALYEKKDYRQLKLYAETKYMESRQKNFQNFIDTDFKIELLLYIYFSCLRTKDYDTCFYYLGLYKSIYQEYKPVNSKFHYNELMYGMLLADFYLCTNKLKAATHELLKLNAAYGKDNRHERLSILLNVNLAAVNFKSGNYAHCAKFLQQAKTKEKKMVKEHTVEVALYTDISTILVQIEMGEKDFAQYLIHTFFRRYKSILHEPDQERIKVFMGLLQKILISTRILQKKDFRAEINSFLEMKEFIPGDKEYISLNAWLISKMEGSSYYEEYISLANAKQV